MPLYKAHAVCLSADGKMSEPETGVVELEENIMGAIALLGLSLIESLDAQGFEPSDLVSFFIERIPDETDGKTAKFWEKN